MPAGFNRSLFYISGIGTEELKADIRVIPSVAK